VLLDTYGRILVDQGRLDTERIGLVYANQDGDGQVILSVAGLPVGALVFERSLLSSPLRLVLELLPPILLASTLLGLLTLVIGLLLMRRVVNPLAEVIAGAQAVAGGDLSARVPVHQSRDDLHALSESFNQMASSLERSDLERRAMLADVAHELRTPLTILRGRLEGILDGVYHADPAHIAPALEEVYLLERLVDDLRLLTLAEARQLPLEERRFDLGKLAQKAVSTFEAEAVELGIHLTIQPLPEPDEDRIVCADPQRVEQVAGNLIGNALRYVPAGGEVTVRLETQGGQSSLIVADNGAGVAADELPYIFDRFWRGEKSRGRASGGAGLGLAIARQLVEAQGGKIWARNLPEGGFEVGFTLKSAGD
jgi:signal transduction histidine kinase